MKTLRELGIGVVPFLLSDLWQRMKSIGVSALDLTPRQALREWAGWTLGDSAWADKFIRQIEALGGKVVWPDSKE
jgi:hypothetical protein